MPSPKKRTISVGEQSYNSAKRPRQGGLLNYYTKKVASTSSVPDVYPKWTSIHENDLNISYAVIFHQKDVRFDYFKLLEEEVEYFSGELSTVKLHGKSHNVPRKQSAYGDYGLVYKYSGVTYPAKPWTKTLSYLRKLVEDKSGYSFNFVLVNRYKDGDDRMGFHKDDEKDLIKEYPIASLSFGAERDFIFKHKDSDVDNVKLVLTDGMLLLMKHPTNSIWLHGLPKRKKCIFPRINLTFRRINT